MIKTKAFQAMLKQAREKWKLKRDQVSHESPPFVKCSRCNGKRCQACFDTGMERSPSEAQLMADGYLEDVREMKAWGYK